MENFDLLIEPSDGRFRATVLASPAGEGSSILDADDATVYGDVNRLATRLAARRTQQRSGSLAQELGTAIFRWLFRERIGELFRSSESIASERRMGLRLRFRLGDDRWVRDVPWEFLFDPVTRHFVAASTRTPLVRYLPAPRPVAPLLVDGPVRILAVTPEPKTAAPLRVQSEWGSIAVSLEPLIRSDQVVLDRLEEPTLEALRVHLRNAPPHVLHFMGHGDIDSSGEGRLYFEDDQASPDAVEASVFASQIIDTSELRLVVINSCEGGRTAHGDPFSGVAQHLVLHGVPAVLAMQYEITDDAALVFSAEFYRSLAIGTPVDVAVAEARKALHGARFQNEIGTPALLMRSRDGHIFEFTTPASAPTTSSGREPGRAVRGGTFSAREISPPGGVLPERSAIVFTDIVGSTRLAETLGHAWARTLERHHTIIRSRFDEHGGFEAGNQGDGFFYLFGSIDQAVRAVVAANRSLAASDPREAELAIRVGIHWGSVQFSSGVGFFGIDLHRGARIADAGSAGQVLLSQPATDLAAPDLAADTSLVDHGEYWLRDLRKPERLAELLIGAQEATPPSIPAVSSRGLPSFPADLVGRNELLDHVRATVAHSRGRIVTLCGVGGVGKTRLAVELIRSETDRPTIFVDLSQVDASRQALPAIARALGLDPDVDVTTSAVARNLDAGRILLAVDNLEQIIECASDLAAVARLAPRAAILATSRTPLRILNEVVIDVEPLPTSAEIGNQIPASTELLLSVAALDEIDRGVVRTATKIAQQLDGLPLALELAAQRVQLLGLAEVAHQLDIGVLGSGRRDGPLRHQTLSETVLWSYRLLNPDAQLLFRLLSQFPAGATTEALVSLGRLDRPRVLAAAADLVEHRLARRMGTTADQSRFVMLRVIREVAQAELANEGELRSTRQAIARTLQQRARRSVGELGGLRERLIYFGLLEELENFRCMFGWAADEREIVDSALRAASDLLVFWWHDHLAEGMGVLRSLTSLAAAESSRYFAPALVAMSILSTYGGDPGESMRLASQAVDISRRSGRQGPTLATALQQLAVAHAAKGSSELALAAADEAEHVARTLPDVPRAFQLVGIGNALLGENQVDRAEAAFTEARDIFDSLGQSWLAAAPAARLGECALRRGDLPEAAELALDGVDRWSRSPGVNGRSRAWSGLARVRWCEGNVEDARAIATDASRWAFELKSFGDLPWAVIVLAAVAVSDDHHERAQVLFANATGMARAYSQPILGALDNELATARNEADAALGDRAAELWRVGERMDLADLHDYLLDP